MSPVYTAAVAYPGEWLGGYPPPPQSLKIVE